MWSTRVERWERLHTPPPGTPSDPAPNSCPSFLSSPPCLQVKPRSLRFTWSMKTTSSRDPNEIMAEIKKVCPGISCYTMLIFILQVLDANNCDYEQRERFLLLCVHGDPNTDSLVQVLHTAYTAHCTHCTLHRLHTLNTTHYTLK